MFCCSSAENEHHHGFPFEELDTLAGYAQLDGLISTDRRARSVEAVVAVGDLEPTMKASFGDADVLRDLTQQRFAPACRGDDVSVKLGRKCFGRGSRSLH